MLSKTYFYLYRFWSKYSKLIAMILVFIAALAAFWLRSQQYFNVVKSVGALYPEAKLDELDPFINYWIVDYMDKHGFLSFFSLTWDNPATCLFWYPECRNLYASEIPGHIFTIYVLYQVVKPLGISLYDLIAFIPPILGALGVIFTALTVKEISKSDIASIVSAFIYALMFLSREVAGFTVKYSFGLFTAPLTLWMHMRLIKRPNIINAIIAGLAIAYAASVWTGVGLTVLPIYITLILAPLILDLTNNVNLKRYTIIFSIEILIPIITMILMPPYRGGRAVIWISFLLAFAAYCIGLFIQRLLGKKKGVKIYAITLLSLIITGVTILGLMATNQWFYTQVIKIIPIAGKILLGLGINPGGLAATVAQYQPGLVRAGAWYMIESLLITVFLGIPMAIYDLYKHKNIVFLAMVLWNLLAWYATYNTAYFDDYSKVAFSVTLGIVIGRMIIWAIPRVRTIGKIVKVELGFEKIIAIIIAIAIAIPSVYATYDISKIYKNKYTMIAQAEGSPIPTDVWIRALYYVHRNISKNSLIISWWDYGYWISVIGNRSTLADGATINSGKIHRLAEFFTHNYSETYVYLKEFGVCKKNETYILIFSPVDIYVTSLEPTLHIAFPIYPMSFGDMPKFVSAIIYLATGKWAMEDVNYNRTRYQFDIYTNRWIIYTISSLGKTTAFVSLNIESSKLLTATMPRLFMWAVTEKLKEIYPGLKQVIVPTILGLDEQANVIIYRDPAFHNITLNPEALKQDIYEIAQVFISQPISIYSTPYESVVRYIFVVLLRPKESILNVVCG